MAAGRQSSSARGLRRPGRIAGRAALVLLLFSSPRLAEPEDPFGRAQRDLRAQLETLLGPEVRTFSVSLLDPHSGLRLDIRPAEVYPSASTMKLGVLLALYRRAGRRRLSLRERIRVRNRFYSVVDRSRYRVPAELSDDCACVTYRARRRRLNLRAVARDMIRSSSNLATNLLIRRLGTRTIHAELSAMGLDEFRVVRGLYDMKAFDRNIHNTLTSEAAMRGFLLLGRPQYFRWALRQEMLEILASTEHRDKLPALLPSGVFVAQKSGYTDDVSHDAGLIFPEPTRPYALAILTTGHKDRYVLEERIAVASRVIFDRVVAMRAALKRRGQP